MNSNVKVFSWGGKRKKHTHTHKLVTVFRYKETLVGVFPEPNRVAERLLPHWRELTKHCKLTTCFESCCTGISKVIKYLNRKTVGKQRESQPRTTALLVQRSMHLEEVTNTGSASLFDPVDVTLLPSHWLLLRGLFSCSGQTPGPEQSCTP